MPITASHSSYFKCAPFISRVAPRSQFSGFNIANPDTIHSSDALAYLWNSTLLKFYLLQIYLTTKKYKIFYQFQRFCLSWGQYNYLWCLHKNNILTITFEKRIIICYKGGFVKVETFFIHNYSNNARVSSTLVWRNWMETPVKPLTWIGRI